MLVSAYTFLALMLGVKAESPFNYDYNDKFTVYYKHNLSAQNEIINEINVYMDMLFLKKNMR